MQLIIFYYFNSKFNYLFNNNNNSIYFILNLLNIAYQLDNFLKNNGFTI